MMQKIMRGRRGRGCGLEAGLLTISLVMVMAGLPSTSRASTITDQLTGEVRGQVAVTVLLAAMMTDDQQNVQLVVVERRQLTQGGSFRFTPPRLGGGFIGWAVQVHGQSISCQPIIPAGGQALRNPCEVGFLVRPWQNTALAQQGIVFTISRRQTASGDARPARPARPTNQPAAATPTEQAVPAQVSNVAQATVDPPTLAPSLVSSTPTQPTPTSLLPSATPTKQATTATPTSPISTATQIVRLVPSVTPSALPMVMRQAGVAQETVLPVVIAPAMMAPTELNTTVVKVGSEASSPLPGLIIMTILGVGGFFATRLIWRKLRKQQPVQGYRNPGQALQMSGANAVTQRTPLVGRPGLAADDEDEEEDDDDSDDDDSDEEDEENEEGHAGAGTGSRATTR